MQWVARYAPDAVAYIWQGRQGCRGVLDVLNGTVSPSGKLPDTIARTPADYPAADHYGADDRNFYAEDIYVGYRYFETFAPEKVLYPFGFGLSYTKFEVQLLSADENADGITAVATVQKIWSAQAKRSYSCTAPRRKGFWASPPRCCALLPKPKHWLPGRARLLMLTAPSRNFLPAMMTAALPGTSRPLCWKPVTIFSLGTDVRHAARPLRSYCR